MWIQGSDLAEFLGVLRVLVTQGWVLYARHGKVTNVTIGTVVILGTLGWVLYARHEKVTNVTIGTVVILGTLD
jgi:hypothetical protein